MASYRHILGQPPPSDNETSLPLRVETGHAASSEAASSRDGASWRSPRFLWTGSGFAVLMLIGLSACSLHPLASHASAKLSHLASASPLPALSPGGSRREALPARTGARPTSFRPSRPAMRPPRRSEQQLSRVSQRGLISRRSMRKESMEGEGKDVSRMRQRGPITRMRMRDESTEDKEERTTLLNRKGSITGISNREESIEGESEGMTWMSQRGPISRLGMSEESTEFKEEDTTTMIKEEPKREETEMSSDSIEEHTSALSSVVLQVLRVATFAVLATLGLAQPAHAAHSYSATTVWLLESCIGLGTIKMGIQGLMAQFFFLSPLPVFRKIARGQSIGQLPLLPYSSMFVNGLLGFTYGALLGKPAIWLCNVPAMLLGAAYTALFCRHCPKNADWLPGTTGAHILGMILSVGFVGGVLRLQDLPQATAIIGAADVAVSVVMFSGPLAALRTVLREKSTRSLLFPMMVATVLDCSLWVFYGAALLHDPVIWLPAALGLLSGLTQAALFWRFGFAK